MRPQSLRTQAPEWRGGSEAVDDAAVWTEACIDAAVRIVAKYAEAGSAPVRRRKQRVGHGPGHDDFAIVLDHNAGRFCNDGCLSEDAEAGVEATVSIVA